MQMHQPRSFLFKHVQNSFQTKKFVFRKYSLALEEDTLLFNRQGDSKFHSGYDEQIL